jgi:hypothetical protein
MIKYVSIQTSGRVYIGIRCLNVVSLWLVFNQKQPNWSKKHIWYVIRSLDWSDKCVRRIILYVPVHKKTLKNSTSASIQQVYQAQVSNSYWSNNILLYLPVRYHTYEYVQKVFVWNLLSYIRLKKVTQKQKMIITSHYMTKWDWETDRG